MVAQMYTCRVVPTPNNPSPPPPTTPLSLFDMNWIHLPYVQPLFLFSAAQVSMDKLQFSSLVESLKSSLSHTLASFYPLAGKLSYVSSTFDVVIDCSDPGVEFTVVTEFDADVERLVNEAVHDTKVFTELVPDIDRRELPVAAMALKVTAFVGGGMAVGLAVHHAVVDGSGTMRFLEAWARACRGEGEGEMLVHDRGVITYSKGEEIARMFLRKKVPNLPKLPVYPSSFEDRLRRTFLLSSASIQSLKNQLTVDNSDHPPPSTFTSISAFLWLCMAHSFPSSVDATNLLFLVDCRSRLDPPVPATYTGNCVRMCHATSTLSELLGPHGLARAQENIARAVSEGSRDPLEACESWVENFKKIPQAGRVSISGSPRFGSSQTDFGWGKPGRMELVSMNLDGEMMLDARGTGLVQMSVALDRARMELFAGAFEKLMKEIEHEQEKAAKTSL